MKLAKSITALAVTLGFAVPAFAEQPATNTTTPENAAAKVETGAAPTTQLASVKTVKSKRHHAKKEDKEKK